MCVCVRCTCDSDTAFGRRFLVALWFGRFEATSRKEGIPKGESKFGKGLNAVYLELAVAARVASSSSWFQFFFVCVFLFVWIFAPINYGVHIECPGTECLPMAGMGMGHLQI